MDNILAPTAGIDWEKLAIFEHETFVDKRKDGTYNK